MIEASKNNLLFLACISFLFTASSAIHGYSTFMSGKYAIIAWLFVVLAVGNLIGGMLLIRKYKRQQA